MAGREALSLYLKPGDVYFVKKPAVITTVLGSCVSVTMYDPHTGYAAICHGLLPECKNKKVCDGTCTEQFKYVRCSIRRMAEHFKQHNIPPCRIEVKLFGGANMFMMHEGVVATHIGKQNVEVALSNLSDERLTLSTYDVGGVWGRKLLFHTDTGAVFLKRLNRPEGPDEDRLSG